MSESRAPSEVDRGIERSLRLYPVFVAGVGFYAWMPVFFTFLASRVSLREVLLLEAIYYVAIVALEVPSGWLSDRFGRRRVLVGAGAMLVGAYACFALADGFAALAIAQVSLAAGLALNSGTDTSFHLACLESLGRAEEYGPREARLSSLGFAMGALSALVGGALALLDFRFAYVASGLGALVAWLAAIGFHRDAPAGARGIGATVRACVSATRQRPLAWMLLVAVAATVSNHLPYELYQPFLERVARTDAWSDAWASRTSAIAGAHVALVSVLALPVAAVSERLAERLGLARHFVLSLALQAGIVLAMAAFSAPWVLAIVALRSLPRALQDAPIRAAVTPHVHPSMRATYLSLQSLAGRLAFAGVLATLAVVAGDDFDRLRWSAAVIAVLFVPVVVLAARSGRDGASERLGRIDERG